MAEDIDKLIEDTLREEDKQLLDRIGREEGFFAETRSVFRGPAAWAMWLVYIGQAVMFFVGVYFAWHFFQANDAVRALHHGLPATVLIILAAVLKTSLGPRNEGNRVIREVKRLELQVAMLRAREGERQGD